MDGVNGTLRQVRGASYSFVLLLILLVSRGSAFAAADYQYTNMYHPYNCPDTALDSQIVYSVLPTRTPVPQDRQDLNLTARQIVWADYDLPGQDITLSGVKEVAQFSSELADGTGRVNITARNITLTGKIDAFGSGWGGGAGQTPPTLDPIGYPDKNGEPGYAGRIIGHTWVPAMCGGWECYAFYMQPGGRGAGYGQWDNGITGAGGGSSAGFVSSPLSNHRGGYAGGPFHGSNVDTTTDRSLLMGSGGGGGRAASNSSFQTGIQATMGGVESGRHSRLIGFPDCTHCWQVPGGGGGGACGGGMVTLTATEEIFINGTINACGAGFADLNGGYGAGGGILLDAPIVRFGPNARVRTVGGAGPDGTGNGRTANGGTVKIFAGVVIGPANLPIEAGRVYVERDVYPTPPPSATPTPSLTPTRTPTPSMTPTPSLTPTATPTNTPSATPTSTPTRTPTSTRTPSPTATITPTPTSSPSPTPTPVPARPNLLAGYLTTSLQQGTAGVMTIWAFSPESTACWLTSEGKRTGVNLIEFGHGVFTAEIPFSPVNGAPAEVLFGLETGLASWPWLQVGW